MGHSWASPASTFQSVKSKFVPFKGMYRPLLRLLPILAYLFPRNLQGSISVKQVMQLTLSRIWVKCFDPFLINNFSLCWISIYSLFSRTAEVASLHTTDFKKLPCDSLTFQHLSCIIYRNLFSAHYWKCCLYSNAVISSELSGITVIFLRCVIALAFSGKGLV